MEDGHILSAGSPESSKLAQEVQKEIALTSGFSLIETPVDIEAEAAKVADRAGKKLMKAETQSDGAVSIDIWILYIKSMGGLWLVAGSLGIFSEPVLHI